MYYLKKILFIIILSIILIFSNCYKNNLINNYDTNKIKQVFDSYISELNNLKKIIIQYDLITQLSHFLFISNGNTKYYLVESEHLNELLNNINQKNYYDLILLDKHYKILYSMNDSSLIGQYLPNILPLLNLKCYNNKLYIFNPFEYPNLSKNYCFAILICLKKNNTIYGYYLALINFSKITTLLPKHSVITNKYNYSFITNKKINTKIYKTKKFFIYKNLYWLIYY